MNRTTVLTLAALVAATGAAPGAVADPPKPITKTYTATAPLPDPTNTAGGEYPVCAQNVPQSFHIEEFEVPAAGRLKFEVTGYQGDWDALVVDAKGQELGNSGSFVPGEPEIVQIKLKKAQTVRLIACNFAGGPTGTGTYTFTFGK